MLRINAKWHGTGEVESTEELLPGWSAKKRTTNEASSFHQYIPFNTLGLGFVNQRILYVWDISSLSY